MPNYDEIEQAVDMTDSLRTIDDVEDVSMEVQVLKLLKDLKKEISYGQKVIDELKEIQIHFRNPLTLRCYKIVERVQSALCSKSV